VALCHHACLWQHFAPSLSCRTILAPCQMSIVRASVQCARFSSMQAAVNAGLDTCKRDGWILSQTRLDHLGRGMLSCTCSNPKPCPFGRVSAGITLLRGITAPRVTALPFLLLISQDKLPLHNQQYSACFSRHAPPHKALARPEAQQAQQAHDNIFACPFDSQQLAILMWLSHTQPPSNAQTSMHNSMHSYKEPTGQQPQSGLTAVVPY
jgi:hypothetical protein